MSTLNPTSYALLGLLSIAPNLSGYDMRKGIQNSIGYFWGESYGQIYPALKRLSSDGLIAPSEAGSNGRERQTYVLTDAGRAALRHWLALPFQNDPPRNEFLLKLFFSREAGPSIAAAHVLDVNERNRRMLEVVKQIEASVPAEQAANPHLPYWMLTLSLGKALTCAALEWGEKALAAISTWEEVAAVIAQPPGRRTQATATRTKAPAKRSEPKNRARRNTVTSYKRGRVKRDAAKSERMAAR